MFSLIILLLLKLSVEARLNYNTWYGWDCVLWFRWRREWQWHYICWIYWWRNLTILWTILCNMPLFSRGQVTRGQLIRHQQIRGQPTMGQLSRGQRKSHVKLITILWKLLKPTVTLIVMQILISLHTQKVTNISPKCQQNVQHIWK